MNAIVERITSAVAEFNESLQHIRDEIRRNQDAASTLESVNLPLTEAKQQVKNWITRHAGRYETEHGSAVAGNLIHPNPPYGEIRLMSDPRDITGLMCWLHGPALEKRLMNELSNIVDPDAPSTEQKRAELTRLADERHELEAAEEMIIREASSAGIRLLRRPDADPAIVLAE